MTKTTLAKCNPNAHGRVALVQLDETGYDPVYYVTTPGYEDGVEFDQDKDAAQEFYDSEVKRLSNTPNWEAQERYDEAHGTSNGYAEWQYNREY